MAGLGFSKSFQITHGFRTAPGEQHQVGREKRVTSRLPHQLDIFMVCLKSKTKLVGIVVPSKKESSRLAERVHEIPTSFVLL